MQKENKNISLSEILQEARFPEILNKAKDPEAPIAKDTKIRAKLDAIDLESFLIKFSTMDFGVQGSRRTHETYLQINKRFSPKLWNTSKDLIKISNNVGALKAFLNSYFTQQHTNYYCSCESFKYSFSYMQNKSRSTLTDDKGNELQSQKESRPPVVRNAKQKGATCKHLLFLIQNIDTVFYDRILKLLQKELKKAQRMKKKGMKYKLKTIKAKEDDWVTIEGTYGDFDVDAWVQNILSNKTEDHEHIVDV